MMGRNLPHSFERQPSIKELKDVSRGIKGGPFSVSASYIDCLVLNTKKSKWQIKYDFIGFGTILGVHSSVKLNPILALYMLVDLQFPWTYFWLNSFGLFLDVSEWMGCRPIFFAWICNKVELLLYRTKWCVTFLLIRYILKGLSFQRVSENRSIMKIFAIMNDEYQLKGR